MACAHGGKILHTYKSAIQGMALRLPDGAVAALRADPNVLLVEQDRTVSVNTTQTGATWGIVRIDQRTLPLSGSYTYNRDGAGVTVHIIDTGIDFTHVECAGRASAGVDEITIGGSAADCNGHGSHVAGTVGGTTYGVATNVISGVPPGTPNLLDYSGFILGGGGSVCGEASCVPVTAAYISHYTGAGCSGTESYYTGYFGFDGVRRSWYGRGVAGTTLRTVTNRF